ncbi:hypothetical protein LEMLEM_LOCUS203 [Lemmus lemmus]
MNGSLQERRDVKLTEVAPDDHRASDRQ